MVETSSKRRLSKYNRIKVVIFFRQIKGCSERVKYILLTYDSYLFYFFLLRRCHLNSHAMRWEKPQVHAYTLIFVYLYGCIVMKLAILFQYLFKQHRPSNGSYRVYECRVEKNMIDRYIFTDWYCSLYVNYTGFYQSPPTHVCVISYNIYIRISS